RQFVGKNGFDIIHSMFPTSDVWGAPLAAFGRRTRIISSRRDMGIVRSRKHEIAYRLLAPWFDQVHAVSHAVRNISIEKDGLSPDKVTTIHNGVDVERILATPASVDLRKDLNLNPAGAVVITAVSKLWPVKGVDIFLRAAAVVLKSLPDTNFVIAGWDKTEHAAELRQLACELGIAPRVRFIGRVPSIISVMKASDIFCLLSRSEGLSNALLEAMTCGLPCVATSVGGNPEVVKDGDSGFLVPTEDVQQAADRILQLLKNPHLTKKLGAGSQRRVHSEFTVEHMVRRVAMLYDELLDVKRLG
ncbi:MAG TPA: glycosyltransferase family 4 protein, partial [Bryobacteraceae bacterium]|nr:glycosyltransferase family 4 protein [Bryobacteraceae bacterium]